MSEIMKISQVIEGHANHLLSKAGMLPDDMAALANMRLDACKTCDKYTIKSTCTLCGCFMPAKTKAINAKCPHPDGPKWK